MRVELDLSDCPIALIPEELYLEGAVAGSPPMRLVERFKEVSVELASNAAPKARPPSSRMRLLSKFNAVRVELVRNVLPNAIPASLSMALWYRFKDKSVELVCKDSAMAISHFARD